MPEVIENTGVEEIQNGLGWINDAFQTASSVWLKSLDIKEKAKSDEIQRQTVLYDSVVENKAENPLTPQATVQGFQISNTHIAIGIVAFVALLVAVKS